MVKEKSIVELKDERNQLLARGKNLVEKAKTEKRKMSEVEEREFESIKLDIRSVDLEISEKEILNRGAGKQHVTERKEPFSLRRAILAQINGQQQRESEASVIAEATEIHRRVAATAENCGDLIIPMEMRAAYTATDEAKTGVVIDNEQMELVLPLEANLVLSQAGVRMLTGLQGNIYWPKHSATKVFWEGENEEAKDGSGKFDKGTLFSPKRLTAYVDISKQLLIQENRSVEALVRQMIGVAIAQKIEQTAFSNAAHADNVPDGLFQGAPDLTGNLDWANVVAMETNADLKNALMGNLAYIMHPTLVGKAKTKVKDSSGAGGFIFGEKGTGVLNGYKALRTNNLPASEDDGNGITFANWADYFLGNWGAIDMTVDPYTQATKGMIRLVVNSYWNMGKVRDESFVTGMLK